MIYTELKYQSKTPLDQKNEGQEGKINLMWGWIPVGGCGHKERWNEGVDGRCVLYMKIMKPVEIVLRSGEGEE
jgi:hypothetical protein